MNIELSKKFGGIVRKERIRQKLSQEELAFKAGLHRTYIGMIERGEKNITIENVAKIAFALDRSISELFLQIEKMTNDNTVPRSRA